MKIQSIQPNIDFRNPVNVRTPIFCADSENSSNVQAPKKQSKIKKWLVNFCITWTVLDIIRLIWKFFNDSWKPLLP